MPRWEDQNTGQIVVVPGHFFLGEESHDLRRRGLGDFGGHYSSGRWFRGRGVDEEKVIEARNVEEDGFIVEEELRKERKVLTEELDLKVSLMLW